MDLGGWDDGNGRRLCGTDETDKPALCRRNRPGANVQVSPMRTGGRSAFGGEGIPGRFPPSGAWPPFAR